MANFQLAPRLYIANTSKDIALLFQTLGANGYAATADATNATELTRRTAQAGADRLKITPLGDFNADAIKNLSATRAVPETLHEINTTFAVGALGVGKELFLKVEYRSSDKLAVLAQWDHNRYLKTKEFQIITKAGDTAADIADRVYEQMDLDKYLIGVDQMFFVPSHTADTAVINFKAQDPSITLTITLEDPAGDSGVTIANATVAQGYTGRGTYHALETWRLATDVTVRPYAGTGEYDGNSNELPVPGRLYASLLFEQEVERPDLSNGSVVNGGPVKGVYAWHLYINEELGEQIKSIIAFFEANTTVKTFYPATTSAAATAAETPEANSTNFLAGL